MYPRPFLEGRSLPVPHTLRVLSAITSCPFPFTSQPPTPDKSQALKSVLLRFLSVSEKGKLIQGGITSHLSERPSRKVAISRCCRDCGEMGTLPHCLWKYNLVQPFRSALGKLLKKLKIELPYDPAIPLLGMIRRRFMHAYVLCGGVYNHQDLDVT